MMVNIENLLKIRTVDPVNQIVDRAKVHQKGDLLDKGLDRGLVEGRAMDLALVENL